MFNLKKNGFLLFAGMLGFNMVQAATIQVDLQGTVTTIYGTSANYNNVFSVGDSISYTFTFDESFYIPNATGVIRYKNSITSFAGSVGSYQFTGGSGSAFVRNDQSGGTIFGGNPYDQLTISNYNATANLAYLGLARDDFTSTGGDVAGFPLRTVEVSIQTDDTSFLSSLDFSEQAVASMASYLSLVNFRMVFSNDAFGITPLGILGDVTSINVTNLSAVPVPAAVWLFGSGLVGLIGIARQSRGRN